MLAPSILSSDLDPAQQDVLSTERDFYLSYDWCLNPYLTLGDALTHIPEEVDRLLKVPSGWQTAEVATNIFLLSCGLLNCIDDYLRGVTLRLPKRLAANAVGRTAGRFVEAISNKPWSQRRVAGWRDRWLSNLTDFVSLIVDSQSIDATRLFESGRKLTAALVSALPSDLHAKRITPPSPFSHLDLTPTDVLRLGDRFVGRFPDRAQPIALLGLRTSGSYFGPLLHAYLATKGYCTLALLTIDPTKGVGRRENRNLRQFAAQGYWAIIVDDPPHTGGSLLRAMDIVCRAGFALGSLKFLAPTHPANPVWFETLPQHSVITLPPEQWQKRELLESPKVELQLGEYFRSGNFTRVCVIPSWRAQEYNAGLQSTASDERGARLKRIFEVQLETPDGGKQTRYVLAKSVGCGWLSYRTFLIGHRLSGQVPPILGLRDGIIYTEWLPQLPGALDGRQKAIIEATASYVAARVRHLKLKSDSEAEMDLKRHNNGSRLLEMALSRAYGRFPADVLMRSPLGRKVRNGRGVSPTLIDGNMHRSEWILGPKGALKTDYEHHGMGKNAPNVSDPAYDLADAILDLALSPDDESSLVKQYIAKTGDETVEQRLFMHKLTAGLWAMSRAQDQLFNSRLGSEAQQDNHWRFMNAWNFLTVQTARYCGALCRRPAILSWQAPLFVLDVDGVLDRRLFGFPCTSIAGIKALSLLGAHGATVALNTARSAAEVKDYCNAYALAGGVAEYGSYMWDAVHQCERVLISAETAHQLQEMRYHLQKIPGVFLDDRHKYSIRAFTYREKTSGLIKSLLSSARAFSVGDGAVAPISGHIVHQLLVDLQLDRLTFHHTTIDTTIVAKEVDKGSGLVALRDWVLGSDAETIAVGDSEPDLAMFMTATRSFAPSNIGCHREARLVGCTIALSPYQRGLLDIVREAIHPNNEYCEQCRRSEAVAPQSSDLFLCALQAVDQKWLTNLLRALLEPGAYKLFIR